MKRVRKPNAVAVEAGAAAVTAVVAEDTGDGVVAAGGAAGIGEIGEIAETAGRKSAKFGVAENRGRRQNWLVFIDTLPLYYYYVTSSAVM
jgi:hypothetical protein